MSKSYAVMAREALQAALPDAFFDDAAARERFLDALRVRPPRNPAHGDLATNAALLLNALLPAEAAEQQSRVLIAALGRLAGVRTVERQGSGYINLTFESAHWISQIPEILRNGAGYGVSGTMSAPLSLAMPYDAPDLAALRRKANAEALRRLGALVGVPVEIFPETPAGEAAGYPAAAAVGRCGEARTIFALIANPPAFAAAFSPILATDRSYDNPVFALPYARMMLRRLNAGREAGLTAMAEGADLSCLRLPGEIALARRLADWPIAVEEALRKADGFYLASFLHDLSLLFFRQFNEWRPVSSDYLREAAAPARVALLAAVDTILDGGMAILGVDRVKEYD